MQAHLLENTTEKLALAKTCMAVFREGRMIGNRAFKTNTAKPATGEIEMNFLAQSPLRLGHALTFDDRAVYLA
jgi:hypothetical protein